MTGGEHAPTQADPPPRAGAAGDHPRGRVPAALAVPWAAGPGVRAGGAGAGRPHAEPAAGGLRAGLVRRRDGGAGHAGRALGGERVRRPAAHRALPEPPLRSHALVPRPDVPRCRTDLRPAGRDRRAGSHHGGTGCPAGPAGDRAQQARRARGLLPADPPAAERLPAAAAGGDEGDTAAGPQRGHRGQPAAERVDQAPADRREHLHPGDQAAGQRAGPGRRAGHLPRGRQLDPAPLAPGHPPAGAKGPSGPGRAGAGHAEPAPAADRRDPGGHLGLPGGGRDLRGARRAGQHRHRGRCVEQVPDQPGHPGQVVAGGGRRGAA